MDAGSILDTVGVEIIGVISPVSICMLLVVLLVFTLSSPTSSSAAAIRTAANLVYLESPSDSPTQKLEGALLNALVFVVLIAVVTFILVLLYYFHFTNFLKHYVRFSAFVTLASMGGSILISLLQHFNIPLDSVTFSLLLFNFTIVGVISVFARGVPILLNQMYMVALGIIVAAWFTKLPEWTTWALLVALAVYDLVAVLAPGGPLKILVELASSRDDDLPALVYEARPTLLNLDSPSGPGGDRLPSLGPLVGQLSENHSSIELQSVPVSRNENSGEGDANLTAVTVAESSNEISSARNPNLRTLMDGNQEDVFVDVHDEIEVSHEDENVGETSPLMAGSNVRHSSPGDNRQSGQTTGVRAQERERERVAVKGIKLGLGDFVFYSVLVGRAAMYDLMTVYACYLAIICGLGCTLILLAVYRQALPALPISIALGVIFYFLTRILMEPFVIGVSSNLMMF